MLDNYVAIEREAVSAPSVLPEYVSFKSKIEKLMTPARELLLSAYDSFEESFGFPNECLPKQFRSKREPGRSFKELSEMVNGKEAKHRQTPAFVPSEDGKASRLERYVAEEYRLSGDDREFEFIEDDDRLERAQRNFIKGLIRAGEIDAEEL